MTARLQMTGRAMGLGLLLSLCSCALELAPAQRADADEGQVASAVAALEQEASVALTATQDTSVLISTPNRNYGAATALDVNRALVQISQDTIAGAVAGDYVVSASLQLTLINGQPRRLRLPRNVTLHRLLKTWNEAGATWNCANDSNPANNTA